MTLTLPGESIYTETDSYLNSDLRRCKSTGDLVRHERDGQETPGPHLLLRCKELFTRSFPVHHFDYRPPDVICHSRFDTQSIYSAAYHSHNFCRVYSLQLNYCTMNSSQTVRAGIGLSNTLGAFLAGLLLAETKYRYQIEADIAPFRGLLLGFFFITVGFNIDLGMPWPTPHSSFSSPLFTLSSHPSLYSLLFT